MFQQRFKRLCLPFLIFCCALIVVYAFIVTFCSDSIISKVQGLFVSKTYHNYTIALHGKISSIRSRTPVPFYMHTFFAAIALLIGGFQFSKKIRTQFPRVHRITGRLYLVCVLIGGTGGMLLSFTAASNLNLNEHLTIRVSFFMLALVWLFTSISGYVAIRSKNYYSHQRWMVRSFSLAFAAVTLRVEEVLLIMIGIHHEAAYPLYSWLCWVPNLLIAEYFINEKSALRIARRAALSTFPND